MTVKRLIAAVLAFGLAAAVGGCSQFSDTVADHWPHWAGGMPPDVPPRPGAPGYNEFVAHGEASQVVAPNPPGPQVANAPQTTATVAAKNSRQPATAAPIKTTIQPAPAPAPPEPEAAEPGDASVENSSVRQGGLY